MIGNVKYSNEKLVALAFANSRTGYSSQPNSTTKSPSIQVKSWVIKKMTDAWALFSLGINQIDIKIIVHELSKNIFSIMALYTR